MNRIGYARVSSVGQSLDVQIDKLSAAGCEQIYSEKKSGSNSERPELRECLRYVRSGEALVVTKLDRLARSVNDLTTIAADLERKGVALVVLDQQIDTSTPVGKLLFNVLASIAEFELAIRAERQADGIKKAQEKGVRFGRPKKLTDELIEQIRAEFADGVRVEQVMKKYRIGKTNCYAIRRGEL